MCITATPVAVIGCFRNFYKVGETVDLSSIGTEALSDEILSHDMLLKTDNKLYRASIRVVVEEISPEDVNDFFTDVVIDKCLVCSGLEVIPEDGDRLEVLRTHLEGHHNTPLTPNEVFANFETIN